MNENESNFKSEPNLKKRNHKKSYARHRGRKGSGARGCKGTAVLNDDGEAHSRFAGGDVEVSAGVEEPSRWGDSANSAAFQETSSGFGRTVSGFADRLSELCGWMAKPTGGYGTGIRRSVEGEFKLDDHTRCCVRAFTKRHAVRA